MWNSPYALGWIQAAGLLVSWIHLGAWGSCGGGGGNSFSLTWSMQQQLQLQPGTHGSDSRPHCVPHAGPGAAPLRVVCRGGSSSIGHAAGASGWGGKATGVQMGEVAGGQLGLYQPSLALLLLITMSTEPQGLQTLWQAPQPSVVWWAGWIGPWAKSSPQLRCLTPLSLSLKNGLSFEALAHNPLPEKLCAKESQA